MSRLLAAIAALSALGAVLPAHAQSRPGWEVGAEAFHHAYREPLEGPDVKDDGLLVGGLFSYTLVRGPWVGKLGGSVAAGAVDYAYGTEALDDVSQAVAQLELDVGRDFRMKDGSTLTPFVGLGARSLSDRSGGEITNEGSEGYDRRVNYRYAAAGVTLNAPLERDRSFTVTARYNRLTGGSSKAYFSSLAPGVPNVDMEFTGGYGLDASAMVNIHRGDRVISVGPFLRYWNIDRSRSVVFTEGAESIEIYEPANSTWQAGVRATYGF